MVQTNLFGTKFENCKLMGIDFSRETKLLNTEFIECILDFANFRALDLRKYKFADCSLVEADFSMCDLRESDFRRANLRLAFFHGAKFGKTDFRDADILGFDLRMENLAGVIFTPVQFVSLAESLGVVIKD
jgi:uncharacterized protein YjbI with pentapeptide repeats